MTEGNLLLKAAGMFGRLLLGNFTKLAFGYAGETGVLEAWKCFSLGMSSWFCAVQFWMREFSCRKRFAETSLKAEAL